MEAEFCTVPSQDSARAPWYRSPIGLHEIGEGLTLHRKQLTNNFWQYRSLHEPQANVQALCRFKFFSPEDCSFQGMGLAILNLGTAVQAELHGSRSLLPEELAAYPRKLITRTSSEENPQLSHGWRHFGKISISRRRKHVQATEQTVNKKAVLAGKFPRHGQSCGSLL